MEAGKYKSYGYVSSIPIGLGLIEVYETRRGKIKGDANGFRFYCEDFVTINARFNINDSIVDHDEFLLKIETMFSVLRYLNKKPTGAYHVKLILEHIKEHGKYEFSVRKMFMKIRKLNYIYQPIILKSKDYVVIEFGKYEKAIDYLKALNSAHKTVNSLVNLTELFRLLEKRIKCNAYGYMNDVNVVGHRNNNLLIHAIVRKFNLLCTGEHRKGRKRLKNEPLLNNMMSLTLNSISLKSQLQNAFFQKKVLVHERELKVFNQLVNNRSIAQQIFLIVKDLTGLDTEIQLMPDEVVQNQLKTELMNLIKRTSNVDFLVGAKEFNEIYKKYPRKELPLITDLTNVFDTDLKNSVFNQVTIEEAYSKGEVFWNEFNNFHNVTVENGIMNFGIVLPSSSSS